MKSEVTLERQSDIVVNKVNEVDLSSGSLYRIEKFPTEYIQARNVDIWLPDHYSDNKKFAVLYMHDGQMLFDSTTTWNKQEWKVDEWAARLMLEEKTKDFIVVAIHNISEIRWQDYFPQKAFESLSDEVKEELLNEATNANIETSFNADNYLKFIVKQVKPYIDDNYSVLTNTENTFVSGSSMGGLISMYAICEYPEIFGGAACISTHWPGAAPRENNPLPLAFFDYMKANIPEDEDHIFYFDYGTETLDQYYPQYAETVDTIFFDKGYSPANYKNLKFDGMDHSENSWNKRLDVPLTFLLNKENN